MQDADEAVRELAQRGVMADLPGAERVVVGPCAGDALSALKACWCRAAPRRRLVAYLASTTVLRPDALVIGLCPE